MLLPCVVGVCLCHLLSFMECLLHPTRSPCPSLCEGRHGGFTPASCRGFNSEGRKSNFELQVKHSNFNRCSCRSSFALNKYGSEIALHEIFHHNHMQHHHTSSTNGMMSFNSMLQGFLIGQRLERPKQLDLITLCLFSLANPK